MLLLHLRSTVIVIRQADDIRQALFCDQRWRWAECRWLMQGIDPMDAVRGLVSTSDTAMQLPEIAGAFPWAYVLGIPLCFAFLPASAAWTLTLVSYIGIAAGLALAGYTFVLRKTCCRLLAVWSVLFLLASPIFHASFLTGNYGFFCGLLLIAAVCIAPAHPVLAGVCLLFASVKPQLAALFYLALLLDHHWKPVLLGGLGTLGAWGIAAAACHTSPLMMLYDTFAQSTSMFDITYSFGLFTHTLPRTLGMFLSMAVCTLLMTLACLWLRRKREALPHWKPLYYSLPAVFSVSWTYCNQQDHSVLFLLDALVLLCLWGIIRSRGMRLSLVMMVLTALCWMLQPTIVGDFLCQMWDACIPGQLTDGFFQDLISWAPPVFWWGFCLLCAAPGRAGERFRALL